MNSVSKERNLFIKQLGGTKWGSDIDCRSRPPTFYEDLPEPPKPPSSRPRQNETFIEPKPIKKK
ncbi:MAG: hypothetical protein F6J86_04420 [Symploca sp. SIO1B1]|nr:hypothetical protein [Symploca sp. SIO1B1]